MTSFNERYIKEADVHLANRFIEKRGDKWVILQNHTGKVLSHHDSKEDAEAAFGAMMANKHGNATWPPHNPDDWREEYSAVNWDW